MRQKQCTLKCATVLLHFLTVVNRSRSLSFPVVRYGHYTNQDNIRVGARWGWELTGNAIFYFYFFKRASHFISVGKILLSRLLLCPDSLLFFSKGRISCEWLTWGSCNKDKLSYFLCFSLYCFVSPLSSIPFPSFYFLLFATILCNGTRF